MVATRRQAASDDVEPPKRTTTRAKKPATTKAAEKNLEQPAKEPARRGRTAAASKVDVPEPEPEQQEEPAPEPPKRATTTRRGKAKTADPVVDTEETQERPSNHEAEMQPNLPKKTAPSRTARTKSTTTAVKAAKAAPEPEAAEEPILSTRRAKTKSAAETAAAVEEVAPLAKEPVKRGRKRAATANEPLTNVEEAARPSTRRTRTKTTSEEPATEKHDEPTTESRPASDAPLKEPARRGRRKAAAEEPEVENKKPAKKAKTSKNVSTDEPVVGSKPAKAAVKSKTNTITIKTTSQRIAQKPLEQEEELEKIEASPKASKIPVPAHAAMTDSRPSITPSDELNDKQAAPLKTSSLLQPGHNPLGASLLSLSPRKAPAASPFKLPPMSVSNSDGTGPVPTSFLLSGSPRKANLATSLSQGSVRKPVTEPSLLQTSPRKAPGSAMKHSTVSSPAKALVSVNEFGSSLLNGSPRKIRLGTPAKFTPALLSKPLRNIFQASVASAPPSPEKENLAAMQSSPLEVESSRTQLFLPAPKTQLMLPAPVVEEPVATSPLTAHERHVIDQDDVFSASVRIEPTAVEKEIINQDDVFGTPVKPLKDTVEVDRPEADDCATIEHVASEDEEMQNVETPKPTLHQPSVASAAPTPAVQKNSVQNMQDTTQVAITGTQLLLPAPRAPLLLHSAEAILDIKEKRTQLAHEMALALHDEEGEDAEDVLEGDEGDGDDTQMTGWETEADIQDEEGQAEALEDIQEFVSRPETTETIAGLSSFQLQPAEEEGDDSEMTEWETEAGSEDEEDQTEVIGDIEEFISMPDMTESILASPSFQLQAEAAAALAADARVMAIEQAPAVFVPPPSPTKSSLKRPDSPKKTVSWRGYAEMSGTPDSARKAPVVTANSIPMRAARPFDGLVFYLEIRGTDGSDQNILFSPLVEELGGRVVPSWTTNGMTVTHVVFKDGEVRTLEKIAASNGEVQLVNIAYLLE